MKGNLIIFGASGHGKVVADAAQASGWKVAGWADDDPEKRHQHIADLPVLATGISDASRHALKHDLSVVVAIGDNLSRKQVFSAFEESRVPIATVIHPSAVVSPRVSIGTGTVIFAGAIVNPDTVVGRNVIINTSASIDHDNRIGDHAHISPGANLGGLVTVGDGTHIGIGATVRNNLSIGSWSMIGAGAVVVREIGSKVVAYGVPARVVKPIHNGTAP